VRRVDGSALLCSLAAAASPGTRARALRGRGRRAVRQAPSGSPGSPARTLDACVATRQGQLREVPGRRCGSVSELSGACKSVEAALDRLRDAPP
jgi:hypothetical protein